MYKINLLVFLIIISSISVSAELGYNMVTNSNKVNVGNCPNGYVWQNGTESGPQCVIDQTGTNINSIQNNGIVHVNSSGDIVADNSTGIIDDRYNVKLMNVSGRISTNGMRVQVKAINLTCTGKINYTYNQGANQKALMCVQGEANWSKEIEKDDILVIQSSTCNYGGVYYDKVATVYNDTYIIMTNNYFGGSCGNTYQNTTPAIVQVYKHLQQISLAGSVVFDIHPITGSPEFSSSLYFSNGIGLYGLANLDVGAASSDNSGQMRFLRAGGVKLQLPYPGQTQNYDTVNLPDSVVLSLGSYGGNSGSGNIRTTGVIQGADAYNATAIANTGGNPLIIRPGRCVGNNTRCDLTIQSSQPNWTSSTTMQNYAEIIKVNYNSVNISNANVTILNSLALGQNTHANLSAGDSNQSILYVNMVVYKSPIIMCSQHLDLFDCKIEIPEENKTNWLIMNKNFDVIKYYNSSRDEISNMSVDPIIISKLEQMKREQYVDKKIVDTPPFSYYDLSTDSYIKDFKAECESVPYQFYRDNECIVNPKIKCDLFEPFKTWNYDLLICEYDPKKECENDLIHVYVNQTCIIDPVLQMNKMKSDCESDISKIWYDGYCLSL